MNWKSRGKEREKRKKRFRGAEGACEKSELLTSFYRMFAVHADINYLANAKSRSSIAVGAARRETGLTGLIRKFTAALGAARRPRSPCLVPALLPKPANHAPLARRTSRTCGRNFAHTSRSSLRTAVAAAVCGWMMKRVGKYVNYGRGRSSTVFLYTRPFIAVVLL